MKITILIDNKNSWFLPYGKALLEEWLDLGYKAKLVHCLDEIEKGDCLFLLSCEKVVGKEVLLQNQHNIVIHASSLPKGRGFSPLTWQILEGKKEIPISLFEATEKVDAGEIYFQKSVFFEGHELLDELQKSVGEKIIDLANKFVSSYPNVKGKKQRGVASVYRKRTPQDSILDPKKTIEEQFNLLRIVDNVRYPAYFTYKGNKYRLEISKFNDRQI